MCVGVPMKILSVDGIAALATDGTREELIDLSLTGPVEIGAWVLSFLGAARAVIDEDEAAKITDALNGLRSLMTGGELGDAFADLDHATPQLPPHLQTAFLNGEKQG